LKVKHLWFYNGLVPRTLSNMVDDCMKLFQRDPALLQRVQAHRETTVDITTIINTLENAVRTSAFNVVPTNPEQAVIDMWIVILHILISGRKWLELTQHEQAILAPHVNDGRVFTDPSRKFYMTDYDFMNVVKMLDDHLHEDLSMAKMSWQAFEHIVMRSMQLRMQSIHTLPSLRYVFDSPLKSTEFHTLNQWKHTQKKYVAEECKQLLRTETKEITVPTPTLATNEHASKKRKHSDLSVQGSGSETTKVTHYYIQPANWPTHGTTCIKLGVQTQTKVRKEEMPEYCFLASPGTALIDGYTVDTSFSMWFHLQMKHYEQSTTLDVDKLRKKFCRFVHDNWNKLQKFGAIIFVIFTSKSLAETKSQPFVEHETDVYSLVLDRERILSFFGWNIGNRLMSWNEEEQLLYHMREVHGMKDVHKITISSLKVFLDQPALRCHT